MSLSVTKESCKFWKEEFVEFLLFFLAKDDQLSEEQGQSTKKIGNAENLLGKWEESETYAV